MSGPRFRVDQVEVFAEAPFGGHRVSVVRDAAGLDAVRLARIAASLGGPTTAFVLPPRRDDCVGRVRVFNPARELPLSVEAAFAAAVALGYSDRCSLEQTVVATELVPGELAGRPAWSMPLARPVVGTVTLDERASVAEALGLDPGSLDDALPLLAVNTGVLTLPVAVRDLGALGAAQLQPRRWAAVVEKAKVILALPFVVEGDGAVRARCLTPSTAMGEQPASGLGAAAIVALLRRLGAVTLSQTVRFGETGRVAVSVRDEGARDGDFAVTGSAAHAGEGTVWG